MSANPSSTVEQDNFFKPIVDFWTGYSEQSKEQTQALLDSMKEATDLNGFRKRWLESLTRCLDGYMRTPAFLETMRNNLQFMTEHKANSEQVFQGLARECGAPRINDISGLFERVRTGQDAILARLQVIESRLDNLQKPTKKTGPA